MTAITTRPSAPLLVPPPVPVELIDPLIRTEHALIEAERYCDATAQTLDAAQQVYEAAREEVQRRRTERDDAYESWQFALRQDRAR